MGTTVLDRRLATNLAAAKALNPSLDHYGAASAGSGSACSKPAQDLDLSFRFEKWFPSYRGRA